VPLNELLPGSNPARDDVQQTDLAYDVVSRYVCNTWQEITAAQGPGAYWYTKEQFSNFVLSIEWRISRREENSGVYIRIPSPNVANALQAADAQGHEIQIDPRGFDSVTGTEGHPLKATGAIYDLQAPSTSTQVEIGEWNKYESRPRARG
jgi:hypothetical protein